MLRTLHARRGAQLLLGLLMGVFFGFFLQKGGVTRYEVIIGQLVLKDFTVVKIMLTAAVTGMIGVHLLRTLGLAQLQPKPGSWGASAIGGIIFGVGFGVLGYCPGTGMGAVAQGSMDALVGVVVGITLGAGILAAVYPKLQSGILNKGYFGELTLPELLKVNPWFVVIPVSILLVALMSWMEKAGL